MEPTIELRCQCGPCRLDDLPEIGNGYRVCGWCLMIFDASGAVVPQTIGECAELEAIETVWGTF